MERGYWNIDSSNTNQRLTQLEVDGKINADGAEECF